MNFDSILEAARSKLPGCVAAGVVDLDATPSPRLLGRAEQCPGSLNGVIGGLRELLCGEDVRSIAAVCARIRGQPEAVASAAEVLVYSEEYAHLFQLDSIYCNVALATICRKRANLGIVKVEGRQLLHRVCEHLQRGRA